MSSLPRRIARSMSMRLRLAVLAAGATLVVVALFGTGVYLVVQARLYGNVDGALQQYAALESGRLDRLEVLGPQPLSRALIGSPDAFVIVYDASGQELGRSLNGGGLHVALPASAAGSALAGDPVTVSVGHVGDHYLLRVVPVASSSGIIVTGRLVLPSYFAVGRSLDDVDATLVVLRLVLLAGGGLAMLSALLLGWIVAGRGLDPVTQLTRAAEGIGAQDQDLSERLPVPGSRDEISRLSMAFNASLDRLETVYRALEDSLSRQRQFVADASHELRTPLTLSSTTPRRCSSTRRRRPPSARNAWRSCCSRRGGWPG